MTLKKIALVFLAFIAFSTSARSADFLYRLEFGPIDGSLNGIDFTGKSVVAYATGNSDDIQSYTLVGYFPSDYIAAGVTIEVDGLSPVNLNGTLPGVVSGDSSVSTPNTNIAGFAINVGDDSSLIFFAAFASGPPLPLDSPSAFSGKFVPGFDISLPTSGGELILKNTTPVPASFSITPVPEPSTIVFAALGATTMIFARYRKNRN
jgi:hypothetical protein